MMRKNTLNVVLIDDDEVDIEAVARCLDQLDIPHVLTVYRSGKDALVQLQHVRRHMERARPFFLLLDIHMPQMNGLEVLGAIRSDPLLRAAIVFVLTVSADDSDIAAAYDFSVAGYLIKGTLGPKFERLAELIYAYYRVVEFPSSDW